MQTAQLDNLHSVRQIVFLREFRSQETVFRMYFLRFLT